MLGNWSFGDYFKKEAIEWAWELLTEKYGIEKDRLYVTVFGGDEKDNLPKDFESIEFWKNWIPEDRILLCSKKDNFWEMGETGPCGPCSEIHVDIRDESDRKKTDGSSLVNTGNPLLIEIWNLVFIQFERMGDGKLKQLPQKHIDTGMGFERLCMVLQKKKSNYDTDAFTSLIKGVEEITNVSYGSNEKSDIAVRVISDHIRTISFSIADGQLPSNTGAGYVIRRILRRAVRYANSFLNQEEPFIYKLVGILANQMGEFYPELKKHRELIEKIIKEEEESFLRTLERGIARFKDYIAKNNKGEINGNFAFELFDTFGFPLDLTELLGRENNLTVDKKGFELEMKKQKDRSRKAGSVETGDWEEIEITPLNSTAGLKAFTGYHSLSEKMKIIKYRKIKIKGKDQFQLVFSKTPFYAESGGQVGDTGFIEPAGISDDSNGKKIFITGTQKENNLIVHFADNLPGVLSGEFTAFVDSERRTGIMNNHTATHLLHEGLREVLGNHVEQKGSLVNPDYLRFDFSHFKKMAEEEIEKVENFVNEKIRKNIISEIREMPLEEAKKTGAMALFGEKYGETVRVVRFGSSVELCGGTHVPATGQIGFFKIISEGVVAAGIRRIEAITGARAIEYISTKLKKLDSIKAILKNPKDIESSILDLLNEKSRLTNKIEKLYSEKAILLKAELLNNVLDLNGVKIIAQKVDLENSSLKTLAFQLKSEIHNLFLVLATENEGKANITLAISENLVNEKKLNAATLIKDLAIEINGGGGGQPGYATAGGTNISGIENVFKKARNFKF